MGRLIRTIEHRRKLGEAHKGQIPWNKGLKGYKEDFKKGKTYEEVYSKEKSEEIKNKIRQKRKLQVINHSVKTRKKISDSKKELFKDKDFLIRYVKTHSQRPTKPEKVLNKILRKVSPKEWKYVGDGKYWVERFNPDFINCNGKKLIIEVYGDYWHNLPNAKKKDSERLKIYKQYGYKTLIIWEHELLNSRREIHEQIQNVQEKIKEFIK